MVVGAQVERQQTGLQIGGVAASVDSNFSPNTPCEGPCSVPMYGLDAIEEFFSLVHVCNVVSAEGVMVAVVEDEASDTAALVVPTATADAGSPASSMPTVAQDATSGIRRDDIALCFIFGSFSYRAASSFAGSC